MLRALEDQFQSASDSYATHYGIDRDPDWYLLKLMEEAGEVTQVWNKLQNRGRRRGATDEALRTDLADELADLLGMVLLMSRQNGVDLAAAVERKWHFRPALPDTASETA